MMYHKFYKQIFLASFFLLSTSACSSYEFAQNKMNANSEQEMTIGADRGKRYEEREATRITLTINNNNEENDNRNESKIHFCCCECGRCCCTCVILGVLGVAAVGVYALGAYAFHWFPQVYLTT